METKRVLLTGIGGFIGSHVLSHFLLHTDWDIVGIDSFRHKGVTDRVADSIHYQNNKTRVTIHTHDLAAPISSYMLKDLGPVDYIINMASESHVDRSLTDPVPFIKNNVDIAVNMLEYARMIQPEAFISISTDEVYGPMFDDIPYKEWSTILPSNPYSASKAAQEAVSVAYWRSYNVPVIITNTMNNFGEYQDVEKYLPRAVRAVLKGEKLTVHGTADEIGSRFWLHARNHADALLWILTNTTPVRYGEANRPDRYNIVGDVRVDNLEMARKVAEVLQLPLNYELVDYHSTRPGHDAHYGLDGTKLKSMGWTPPVDFEESLARSVSWYKQNPKWLGL